MLLQNKKKKKTGYTCPNTQYNHCSTCISTKGIHLKHKEEINIMVVIK